MKIKLFLFLFCLLIYPDIGLCWEYKGGVDQNIDNKISTHNTDISAHSNIPRLSMCKIITNPNDADAFMFAANQSGAVWTVNEVRGVALGGTSVVFTLQECDANGANCVQINDAKTISTGTAGTGTITNSSVDDNDVIIIDIGTVTGAVTQLIVCAEVQ